MNRSNWPALLLLAALLGGCSSYRAFERGRDYETQKDFDKAIGEYQKALEVDPDNSRYKAALQAAKLEASRFHFERGKSYMAAGQPELAILEYELTAKLDPTNQFAIVELAQAVKALQVKKNAEQNGTIDEKKRRAKAAGKAQPPQLDPASDEPISLSFPRPTPVKEIYRALGSAFGINIMFDQQVKDDPIQIELQDVTAQQALERLMQASGHFYKVLDERSIIVVPDNPQARREYEDLVIQTFYLSNGDAEQVTNVVRTMIEARNVFPLKALNAITIRDTADKVRIAQEIIEANDKAKAEVVVSVELLQIDVTKARDLGMQITGMAGGVINATDADGEAITRTTLDGLRQLGSDAFTFNMPSAIYSFVKSTVDSQLLARPQLRISEGEAATLHIGRRIPLPVSTFTSTNPTQGGVYAPVTSYTYQDIGIKISIEPRVHHNREVTLKLKVEVSDLAGNAPDTNPPQPIIGTRTIESVIRLQDGETNFLAGLIREDEASSRGTTPFLGDIPLLGRLFTREEQDFLRTDLVLTMTPHIIRIANITEDDLAPMWVGTGTNLTFRGVSPRIESQSPVDPFNTPVQNQFNTPATQVAPPPADANEPSVIVPRGTGPTDIFTRPTPPVPTPPPPQPETQPPGDSASLDGEEAIAATAAASYGRVQPRIAAQPASIALAPGSMRAWNLVGMDLEGLTTPEIRMRFDPRTMSVPGFSLGSALAYELAAPPVVSVDAAQGLISIRPSDGQPLRFVSGGEILNLNVLGSGAGEAWLVIEPMVLTAPGGNVVEPMIHGGKVRIQ